MQQAEKIRLDKWLWAARFFRTRTLAKQAIAGGKVRVNSSRAKASRELKTGDEVCLRVGWDEKTVTVTRLSDQRRGAPEAALLYEETEESIQHRERQAAMRSAAKAGVRRENRKPGKKERRQLLRIREKLG